LLTDVWITN